MLPGNYTIESSSFTELVGAQMDVDETGENGSFAFPNGALSEMKFDGQEKFEVQGSDGIWKFHVTKNLVHMASQKIDADGDVDSPTVNPDEPGTFTATASTGSRETEDRDARAATEGY